MRDMDIVNFEKYTLSAEREEQLFQEAIFLFDSSALLDFYYYSDGTKKEIFEKVFHELEGRLFIPDHVQFEFLKNRGKVIRKPIESYKNLLSKNEKMKDSGYVENIENQIQNLAQLVSNPLKGQLTTLIEQTKKKDKHPYFETDFAKDFERRVRLLERYLRGFERTFQTFKETLTKLVNEKAEELEKISEEDQTLNEFKKYFQVGKEFSYDEITEIVKEGQFRYDNSIPPGYKDSDMGKIGFQVYGDLIIWKQIISLAKGEKKPVVFVLNDGKEDWWVYEGKNKSDVPRYELIKEISDIAEVDFWMFDTNQFLEKARRLIGVDIEESAIAEVQQVQRPRKWPDEFAFAKDTITYELELQPSLPSKITNQELIAAAKNSLWDFERKNDYGATDKWPDAIAYGVSERIPNGLSYKLSSRPSSNKTYIYTCKLFQNGKISFSRSLKWEGVDDLLFDVEKFLEFIVLFSLFSYNWLRNLSDNANAVEKSTAKLNIRAAIPKGCFLHVNTNIIEISQSTPAYDGPHVIRGENIFNYRRKEDYSALANIVKNISGFVLSEFSFVMNNQIHFPIVRDEQLSKFTKWIINRVVNI